MQDDLVKLYCLVDDFWKGFKIEWNKHLIEYNKPKRGPEPELTTSEMMTITILFHQSHFRNFKHFLQLITTLKSNMKNKLINLRDKILLRKRAIIETINDQLKNISQLEHSRHRGICNFFVNALAALIAYIHKPKKPKLKMNDGENKLIEYLG